MTPNPPIKAQTSLVDLQQRQQRLDRRTTPEARFWAAEALLPGGCARGVTFVVDGGRFRSVTAGTAPGDATLLPGVVLPGFANVHSHAFHRRAARPHP